MSVEGKKLAVKKAIDEATARFLDASGEIYALYLPYWVIVTHQASAAAIAKSHVNTVINTPADRFNDDGTLKPYDPEEGETLIWVNK